MNEAATSGGTMAYLDEGEGTGPTVVLLHGFPTSSFLWRREVPLLGSRMRVIAPDLIGYGRSAKPTDAGLNPAAQAGYVGELLRGLGVVRLAAVGHGLGGTVAHLLAAEGIVETIVLLDAPPVDPTETWPANAFGPPDGGPTREWVSGRIRETVLSGVSHRERIDESTLTSYVEPWLSDPSALARAADAAGSGGSAVASAAFDIPTLIIWGEDDPYVPVDLAERLGDDLPGSTVALLPGCSHFITEDAGPTVDQLIYEFLRLRYLGEAHSHWHPEAPVQVYLEPPPPHAHALEDDE